MTSWSSGYVTDIDYFPGFYAELSPERCAFGLLSQGLAQCGRTLGPGRSADPAYLELGFGYGVSLAVHAAACPGTYWGADFNPAHALYARDLAEASGADMTVADDSFEELLARPDLPQFDMIAVHGVWSWVSDSNRDALIALVRRHLKPGGVLNISYNCEPGWAQIAPWQRLVSFMAHGGGRGQTISERADAAVGFMNRLREAGAACFTGNPALADYVDGLGRHNAHYVIHEHLNRHWRPMLFAETAELLAEAKVGFAASARPLDYVSGINLTAQMQEVLTGISDPVVRQTVYDYCINRRFRWDLFARGVRRMPATDQREKLLATRVALASTPSAIPMTVPAALGEAELRQDIYRPLIDALAKDGCAPRSLASLRDEPGLKSLEFGQLAEAVIILVGAGHAHPVQQEEIIERARPACARLNTHLCTQALSREEVNVLASPVIGTGVTVPRFHQMFLHAIAEGHKTPRDWAKSAWEALSACGHLVLKDDKTLETPEENLAELESIAKTFQSDRLPILKTLGIA